MVILIRRRPKPPKVFGPFAHEVLATDFMARLEPGDYIVQPLIDPDSVPITIEGTCVDITDERN